MPPPRAGSWREPAQGAGRARHREARQQRVVAELPAAGVPVRVVWVDTPLEVCLTRNAVRPQERRVPPVGIHAALARFEPPSVEEGFARVDVVRPSPGLVRAGPDPVR